MSDAGGSAATWQVLLLVRSRAWSRQAEMAEAMGITGATLTHHLNALERQGLVRRWREDGNRRVQRVELTDAGSEQFDRLREVAVRHDARLRAHLAEDEIAQLDGAPRQAARRRVGPAARAGARRPLTRRPGGGARRLVEGRRATARRGAPWCPPPVTTRPS